MKIAKSLKILLLLYLATAVTFPSYQGYEEGAEFHFFSVFETPQESSPRSDPGIASSSESDHSHELLHFYPAHQSQRHLHKTGARVFLIDDEEYPLAAAACPEILPPAAPLLGTSVCGHRTSSGLSPPTL